MKGLILCPFPRAWPPRPPLECWDLLPPALPRPARTALGEKREAGKEGGSRKELTKPLPSQSSSGCVPCT